MKNHLKKKILILLSVVVSIFCAKAQNYRYTNTIFPYSSITSNVVYGQADFLDYPYSNESNTSTGNLIMDIYQPSGDTCSNRPVIIFAHGGGFFSGSFHNNDMVAFCDSFARMGYVTATIEYRMGVYTSSNIDLHYTRTIYRAVQDGRTAVRYFRANAAAYGIDPNKVYFVGSSAGAFIGLHSIYMDDLSEKPAAAGAVNYTAAIPPFNFSGPDLGAYDIGANLSFNGEPDALVALWGAVASTSLIAASNNQPVFLVHGTTDPVVPFNVGSPFSMPSLPTTYGSKQINLKLDTLGLTNKETYFVNNAGHEFYGVTNGAWNNGSNGNAYWDTIIEKAAVFLWNQHKPTANFTSSISSLNVTLTNASTGSASCFWELGDGNTTAIQNPTHTYSSAGNYTVKLFVENNNCSWDTASQQVITTITGMNEPQTDNFTIYPNPSSALIHLHFHEPVTDASLLVMNIYGQLMCAKLNQSGNDFTIDVSGETDGVYFLQIITDQGSMIKKIIKN